MQSVVQHPREPPCNGAGAEWSAVFKEVSGNGVCGEWSTMPERTSDNSADGMSSKTNLLKHHSSWRA